MALPGAVSMVAPEGMSRAMPVPPAGNSTSTARCRSASSSAGRHLVRSQTSPRECPRMKRPKKALRARRGRPLKATTACGPRPRSTPRIFAIRSRPALGGAPDLNKNRSSLTTASSSSSMRRRSSASVRSDRLGPDAIGTKTRFWRRSISTRMARSSTAALRRGVKSPPMEESRARSRSLLAGWLLRSVVGLLLVPRPCARCAPWQGRRGNRAEAGLLDPPEPL